MVSMIMETIKITFPNPDVEGIRCLTAETWSMACLVIPRSCLRAASALDDFRLPGVYILAGPAEIRLYPISPPDNKDATPPTLIQNLYIGKSDTLDERVAGHDKNKTFWSTAFVFYRNKKNEALDGGQLAQLEADLIRKAREGVHNVTNVSTPNPPLIASDSYANKIFLGQIEKMLRALGQDFFTPENNQVLAPPQPDPELRNPVPTNLQAIVGQLEEICLNLPSTEFYATQVPDLRAKVLKDGGSRVFARILFLKHAVRLALIKENKSFTLKELDSVNETIREQIKDAHERALQELTT